MCLGRNCAFRIACFQCLQNIVKLPFAMCPAACNPKFIRSFTGKLVITVSLPVTDDNDNITGIIGADIQWEALLKRSEELEEESRLQETSSF